jgi:hypothetical protein
VTPYHDLKYRDVITHTADSLLRDHLITGPVHAAMTTPAQLPPLIGVDDPEHYEANVNAYLRSVPQADAFKVMIEEQKASLEETKKTVFSPALTAFDQKVTAYQNRHITLAEYIEALAPQPRVGQAGIYVKTLAAEKALHFPRVEEDRKRLVEVLVKRLTQNQTAQLVQQSAGYRMGQIRYADFYGFLHTLCQTAQIDLTQFPHMDAYLNYVMLSDQIDAEILMTELSTLQSTRFAALAKTKTEKTLVAQSAQLHLTARLLDFALTPEEWSEYEFKKNESPSTMDLSSFESFYTEAHARDDSITHHLLKAMENENTPTALLVTGGYHSPGIDERLRQAGVTVISFTPRIEKVDTHAGTSYLSVFSQEKSPLEKLFAGDKLFVSQHPASPATTQLTGVVRATGIAALMNGLTQANETTERLNAPGTPQVTVELKGDTAHVTATDPDRNQSVTTGVSKDTDGSFRFTKQALPPVLGIASALALFPLAESVLSSLSNVLFSVVAWDPMFLLGLTVTLLFLDLFRRTSPPLPALAQAGDPWSVTETLLSPFRAFLIFQSDNESKLDQLIATYNRATRVAKEVSLLIRTTEDFVKSMLDVLHTIYSTILEGTKDLENPQEAIPLIKKISEWEGVGMELPALERLEAIAEDSNSSPEIRRQIRERLEHRAHIHFKKREIEPWVGIHQILSRLGTRQLTPVGKTNLTDWHILVFLQFFLETLDGNQGSATNLDVLLPELSSNHIEQFNKASLFVHLIYYGKEAMERGALNDNQLHSIHAHHSDLKINFGQQGFSTLEQALYTDDAFFDRLLYFLYSAFDIDQKIQGPPSTSRLATTVTDMLAVLETELTARPTPDLTPKIRPATWPSTFVRGYFFFLTLGLLIAYGTASLLGVDPIAVVENLSPGFLFSALAFIPISIPLTSIYFAPWWESPTRIKNPALWAENHAGVDKKESAEYKEYLQIAEELNEISTREGNWAGIKAHSRQNRLFWWVNFRHYFTPKRKETKTKPVAKPKPTPQNRESGFIATDMGNENPPRVTNGDWITLGIQKEIVKLRTMSPHENLVVHKQRESDPVEKKQFQAAKQTFTTIRLAVEAKSISIRLKQQKLLPENQKKILPDYNQANNQLDELLTQNPENRDQMIAAYTQLANINSLFQILLDQIETPKAPPSPRATWTLSKIVGYGVFLFLSLLVAEFLGIDLPVLLAHPLMVGLSAMALFPLSAIATSTFYVAALIEHQAILVDVEAWVLRHRGVVKGSEDFHRLMAIGKSIKQIHFEKGLFAALQEHNRHNRESYQNQVSTLWKQGTDLFIKGSVSKAPTAPKTTNDTFLTALLALMPGRVESETYSVRALLTDTITKPAIDLDAMGHPQSAPVAVDADKVEAAKLWLFQQLGIQTQSTGLIPLTAEGAMNHQLHEIAKKARILHPRIIFYVKAGTPLHPDFLLWVAQQKREGTDPLVTLDPSNEMFKENTLSMRLFKAVAPQDGQKLQVYIPEGVVADFEGVLNDEAFGEKAVRPLGLLIYFDRFLKLAHLLATQA